MAKPEMAERSREMRRGGASIKSIARTLGVSPGSVSSWCVGINLSPEQREKLDHAHGDALQRSNTEKSAKHSRIRQDAKDYGSAMVGGLSDRDRFILGVGLYWGEGSKGRHEVRLTNMDPIMLHGFIRWLALLGVPPRELKVRVDVSPSHDKGSTAKWWAGNLAVDISQVVVYQRVSPTSKHKTTRPDYHGVASVSLNNTVVQSRILGMLSAVSQERTCSM